MTSWQSRNSGQFWKQRLVGSNSLNPQFLTQSQFSFLSLNSFKNAILMTVKRFWTVSETTSWQWRKSRQFQKQRLALKYGFLTQSQFSFLSLNSFKNVIFTTVDKFSILISLALSCWDPPGLVKSMSWAYCKICWLCAVGLMQNIQFANLKRHNKIPIGGC
jgi:hypothetical protein